MNKRRIFLINSLVGVGGALAAMAVNAAPEKAKANNTVKTLDEKSQKAVALGYVTESKTKDQVCSNCALYVAGENKTGKCGIFAGELVAAGGWCKAYAKKA